MDYKYTFLDCYYDFYGVVAKMVNAPDWKSGHGGSSPPRTTIILGENKSYFTQLIKRFNTIFSELGRRFESDTVQYFYFYWWFQYYIWVT